MSLALANLVRSVLSRPETAKINFSVGGMMIEPSSFRMVKEKILGGQIDVVYDRSLAAKVAKYRPLENTLHLSTTFRIDGISTDQEALIIHECVHAAADLSALAVKIGLDEAAAYVAQCLYFYYRNEAALKRQGVRPTFTDPILEEAWKVGTLARSKNKLSDRDIGQLLWVISQHRLYKKNHTFTRPYDGV